MKRIALYIKVQLALGMGQVRVFRLGGFVHVQSRDEIGSVRLVFCHFSDQINLISF